MEGRHDLSSGRRGVGGDVVIGRAFVGRHFEKVPKKGVWMKTEARACISFLHKLGAQLMYLLALSLLSSV